MDKLTVLSGTRVDLEGLLIREDIDLNTRVGTGNSGYRALGTPVVRAVLFSVDQEASIVAHAAATTTTDKVVRGEVGTKLLRCRPEVPSRSLLVGQDGSVRNENTINSDTLTRVRQVERVVVDGRICRVLESIEVPVGLFQLSLVPIKKQLSYVRAQHDRGLLSSCDSNHLEVPLATYRSAIYFNDISVCLMHTKE